MEIVFLRALLFRDEFFSINQRPGLPLQKYGVLLIAIYFFNGFCVTLVGWAEN